LNPTEQHLKRIQDKLQQLLKQYSIVQKENSYLKEELGKSKQVAETLYKNIDVLKQQVNVLQLSAGEMNGTGKKEMAKRIDSYLKEIDRCIASLSA
jgi:septal ring factor EnvC (AmiA/AmiB activator)